MRRCDALVNIIAQLVHSPDQTTATHIKNFIDLPRVYDKPVLVEHIKNTLNDESSYE